ncbi:hypothetical protein P5V15_009704 [Pogonomyrmex californicus]
MRGGECVQRRRCKKSAFFRRRSFRFCINLLYNIICIHSIFLYIYIYIIYKYRIYNYNYTVTHAQSHICKSMNVLFAWPNGDYESFTTLLPESPVVARELSLIDSDRSRHPRTTSSILEEAA